MATNGPNPHSLLQTACIFEERRAALPQVRSMWCLKFSLESRCTPRYLNVETISICVPFRYRSISPCLRSLENNVAFVLLALNIVLLNFPHSASFHMIAFIRRVSCLLLVPVTSTARSSAKAFPKVKDIFLISLRRSSMTNRKSSTLQQAPCGTPWCMVLLTTPPGI